MTTECKLLHDNDNKKKRNTNMTKKKKKEKTRHKMRIVCLDPTNYKPGLIAQFSTARTPFREVMFKLGLKIERVWSVRRA